MANILFLFLLAAGNLWIIITLGITGVRTVFLFNLIAVFGSSLITIASKKVGDKNVLKLSFVWYFKLIVIFFLLQAAWIPSLVNTSTLTSLYDPIRYYNEAANFNNYGWDVELISLGYMGVVYYYALIFYVFGINPVAPALFNSLLTLIATLMMLRVAYFYKGNNNKYYWVIGLAMILPEVVWYDVLTSKDSIVMSTLTILIMTAALLLSNKHKPNIIKMAFGLVACGISVGLLRTPMLVSTLIIFFLYFLLLSNKHQSITYYLTLFIMMIFLLIISPALNKDIGGFIGGLGEAAQPITLEHIAKYAETKEWTHNSIGYYLIPKNEFQIIAFSLPRAICYIIAPLPIIGFKIENMLSGIWRDWQNLLTTMTSLIFLFFMPYSIGAMIASLRRRSSENRLLLLGMPGLVLLLTIAAGNYMIHVRYRVMADLLLWGSIWVGLIVINKFYVQIGRMIWGGVILSGLILYLITKIR